MSPRLSFATIIATFSLSAALNTSYADPTIAYEVRRSVDSDPANATLVGVTTQTEFVDPTASEHGASYHYFVRASGGTATPIKVFGGNYDAEVFLPRTSSDEVTDLVFYTQQTTLSGTFYLLDDDAPANAQIVWPEQGDHVKSETLTLSPGQQPRLTVQLILKNRLWKADSDETAEILAYDPFSQSLIADLGPVSKAPAVAWDANLGVSNTPQGARLTWDAFNETQRNSLASSISITREIPLPVTPTVPLVVNERLPRRIQLSWQAETTAARYAVYRSETNDFSTATLRSDQVRSTTYTDGFVTPGRTYYYWITSVNDRGESATTASLSATATNEIYQLAVRSNFGSVDISPRKDYYAEGDVVTLTASPRTGYGFESWAIDETSDPSTTTTLTIQGNTSAIANYALDMPQAYRDWLSVAYPSQTELGVTGPDRDADGDGLNNLLEFTLATDEPETAGELLDFKAPQANTGNGLTYSLSAYPAKQRGSVSIQTSRDLQTWSDAQLQFQDGAWEIVGATAFDLGLSAEESTSHSGYWTLTLQTTPTHGQPSYLRLGASIAAQ